MGQAQSEQPFPAPSPDEWPPTDRPLPEDPFDPILLSTYKCPIQDCSNQWCPFGHSNQGTNPEVPNLRTLPKCFCVERLLGRCESTSLERLNPGDLVKCEAGFHPEAQDMVNPDRFVRQVASAILGRCSRAQADREPDCVICLKPLPTWDSPTNGCNLSGYLENCIHRFCGRCIQAWRTRTQPDPNMLRYICPTCRAPSSRIMLWPEALVQPIALARRFALQKACMGIHVQRTTVACIKELDLSSGGGAPFEFGFKNVIFLGRIIPGLKTQVGSVLSVRYIPDDP